MNREKNLAASRPVPGGWPCAAALLVAGTVLCGSCQAEQSPFTQVDVVIEADQGVKAEGRQIEVEIRTSATRITSREGLSDEFVKTQPTRRMLVSVFPLRFSLVPEDNDAGHHFWVQARVFSDDKGKVLLSESRILGAYVQGQLVELRMRLYSACDSSCAFNTSCDFDGECRDAEVTEDALQQAVVSNTESYVSAVQQGSDPRGEGIQSICVGDKERSCSCPEGGEGTQKCFNDNSGWSRCSPCARPAFCLDGTEITVDQLCDGSSDCDDLSDEQGCVSCDSGGKQIPSSFICNGSEDCGDGSDEQDCSAHVCGDGTEVPRRWVCDGGEDCEDGSDEAGPDCVNHVCGDGEEVPRRWVCDGGEDCEDGSDEQGCATYRCESGEEVLLAFQCDGYVHCSDGSDETGAGCATDLFTCADGQLVVLDFRCDGGEDCEDDSDEQDCPAASCGDNQVESCTGVTCLPDTWLGDDVCDEPLNCAYTDWDLADCEPPN